MAKQAFVAKLPMFDENRPLEAVLDDPEVAASGAVVSTNGAEYRIHILDDLYASRSKLGDSATFADLKTHAPPGRPLRTYTEPLAKEGKIVLSVPTSKKAIDTANKAFRAALGVAPRLEGPAGRALAWVFSHSGTTYVMVSASYVCSKYGENDYDQDDYLANNGKCPRHADSALIRKL